MHGYAPREAQRLSDQANTLAELLHHERHGWYRAAVCSDDALVPTGKAAAAHPDDRAGHRSGLSVGVHLTQRCSPTSKRPTLRTGTGDSYRRTIELHVAAEPNVFRVAGMWAQASRWTISQVPIPNATMA